MKKQRYIIRMADGEMFPFLEAWLKIPGMVEYDPAIHGYRAEAAKGMGLVEPSPTTAPVASSVEVSEHAAGQPTTKPTVAAKPKKAESQAPEPDLSDVFTKKK
jgi:hypothetical protein